MQDFSMHYKAQWLKSISCVLVSVGGLHFPYIYCPNFRLADNAISYPLQISQQTTMLTD